MASFFYILCVWFLEVQHLDGRQRGLFAFVAVFAAGAVEGLLFVEGGQHAEDDGLTGLDVYFGDAVGYSLADVIEVWGLALDDAAQAEYGVDVLFFGLPEGAEGELEGAWYVLADDVFFPDTVFEQRLYGAAIERFRNFGIPFGHDNGECLFGEVYIAFYTS